MDPLQAPQRIASRKSALLFAVVMLLGCAWKITAAQPVVATGYGHSCAVVEGEVLRCWGKNSSGQLGNGTFATSRVPAPVSISDTVTVLAAGGSYTCAVVDGGLECWGQLGDILSATPVSVVGLDSGVTALAAGVSHICAVVSGGLKCWGRNYYGQLGTHDNQDRNTPAETFPPGSGVTAVAAGAGHTCAVVGGQAKCWGLNTYGTLGTGNYDSSWIPVDVVGISNAQAIAAGEKHSCALLSTGHVRCWGSNESGSLGDGTFVTSPTARPVYGLTLDSPPQPIELAGVTAITAGGNHTCAAAGAGMYCWGYNEYGQLGLGTTLDLEYAHAVGGALSNGLAAIAGGSNHTCAVAGNEAYCWGSDEAGQLGDAAASPYIPEPLPSLAGLSATSAGWAHGCAVEDGGAHCWGSNRSGQLGTGTQANSSVPLAVSGLGPGSSVTAVAAGHSHSCAMELDGDVACWGENEHGQLGSGNYNSTSTPVSVSGLDDATDVAAGAEHACAVRSDGHVACWGSNDQGRLGDGTIAASNVPVTVVVGQFLIPLGGATAVTAGDRHTCAIAYGGAFCWGSNATGQLGNDSPTHSDRAKAVSGIGSQGSGVTAISAGALHTCAVVGGGVQCWGYNGSGRLGNGTFDNSTVPVPVSGIDNGASDVASGASHSCAVIDGGVQCWGANDYGQLGDGTFLSSNLPVMALPPGSGASAVTAGVDYTCASGTSGGHPVGWCWGNGMHGRLANGKLGYSDTPVRVLDTIFANGFGFDS